MVTDVVLGRLMNVASHQIIELAMLPVKSLGVSVFLLKSDGPQTKVLLLRRAGKHLNGQWCQVAGGIEAGEMAWQTALREVRDCLLYTSPSPRDS